MRALSLAAGTAWLFVLASAALANPLGETISYPLRDPWVRGAQAMLARHEKALAHPPKLWENTLASLRRLSPDRQIYEVNRFFNWFPYKTDRQNFRRPNHFATPFEFMARGGDCEEFAFAKYLMLVALGFHPEKMWVVLGPRKKAPGWHAFTVVSFSDGEYVGLDNLYRDPLRLARVQANYQATYALTATQVFAYSFRIKEALN